MINGNTKLIAHLGFPTSTFKAPMIYNPYFQSIGLNAVVVPMGIPGEDYATAFAVVARFSNFHGALITMPHKVTTLAMLDHVSTAAKIAGACNAVRRDADGGLSGDMFDGEGFVRGMQRKGRNALGAKALVVGTGGVGSAIAASLAGAGVAALSLYDVNAASADALAARLRHHYPALSVQTGSADPDGHEVVVNATPLGMNAGDAMPMDITRLAPGMFVGEVVMKNAETAFLAAARQRGCQTQIGVDMLFEQIPAYLEFFGFPSTTADHLRQLAQISY